MQVDGGNDHKPNLLANLLLIDDLMQIIQNLKNEYQNFIIKQVGLTIFQPLGILTLLLIYSDRTNFVPKIR